jgi:uncharacterized protein (TIGR02246 family)
MLMEPSQTSIRPAVVAVDEASIRQVFAQLAVAWNAGDARAFSQYFTEDCDYVTFAGQHIKGRQANEQIHNELFNSWVLKSSTMHPGPEPASIAFLSTNVALMHSTGTIQLRFQKKPPLNRLSIQTIVLTKASGQWKVRAFHNCRVQKPGLFQQLLMAFKSK